MSLVFCFFTVTIKKSINQSKCKMSSIIFIAFLLLCCCCFFYLLAQACHLNQSKKLSLLSQLALPYNKISSRSPSPKARYKLLSSRAAGSDEVSCFEPSPLPNSSPPSPSMQLDIEQGTAAGAWRNMGLPPPLLHCCSVPCTCWSEPPSPALLALTKPYRSSLHLQAMLYCSFSFSQSSLPSVTHTTTIESSSAKPSFLCVSLEDQVPLKML